MSPSMAKRGRHAAGGRMRQHRDVRQARRAQARRARPRSWPSASARTGFPACARRRWRRSTRTGSRISSARSAAQREALADHRAHRAAHEGEVERGGDAGRGPCSLPCIAISASRSPVAFCAALMRSAYFFWSLNFSASVGPSSAPISSRAVRVEQRGQARAGADRHVVVALRADLEVFLELRAGTAPRRSWSHFSHRPSGTLRLLPPSVRMREGISFFSQHMRWVVPFRLRDRGRPARQFSAASRRQPAASRAARRGARNAPRRGGGWPASAASASARDQRAADHHAIGVARPWPRRMRRP